MTRILLSLLMSSVLNAAISEQESVAFARARSIAENTQALNARYEYAGRALQIALPILAGLVFYDMRAKNGFTWRHDGSRQPQVFSPYAFAGSVFTTHSTAELIGRGLQVLGIIMTDQQKIDAIDSAIIRDCSAAKSCPELLAYCAKMKQLSPQLSSISLEHRLASKLQTAIDKELSPR